MNKVMGVRGPFTVPPYGVYHVEVDRKRKSLRTKDLKEAKVMVREIKKLYLEGRLHKLTGECSKTLGDFTDEYLELADSNQKRNTARANRLALQKLVNVAGRSIRLDRLTSKHIEQVRAANAKLSVASLNNYLRHLRSIMNQAVAWGYLKVNPFSGVKEVRTAKRVPAFIEQREVSSLLAGIKDVDARRMVAAYLATGVRRSELLPLTWEDVDLNNARFKVFRKKTQREEWLPASPAFIAVLRVIGPGSGRVFPRWNHPDTISHVIKAALRESGFGHLRLHDLRHSFASQLAMAGESQAVIADLLGHSNVSTAAIYVHVAQGHRSGAASKIKWGPVDLG